MPLQPGPLTEPLVQQILAMYAAAEADLLQRIAARLAKGLDSPDWAERQLLEVQMFRREAEIILAKLQAGTPVAAQEAASLAINRGAATAQAEIAHAIAPAPAATSAGVGAAIDTYTLAAADLTHTLSATRPSIFRSITDAYRDVIAKATQPAMVGAKTQRQAVADALSDFASRGITGFRDRKGRQWELQSYVDMATRSALMNAAVEGHTAKLEANGFDLVIVSDVPQECARCRVFEGKVLALSSRASTNAKWANGKPVRIAGTLAQARSQGLYHPGCRHSHSAFIPGRTRSFGETADPQGQKDREKLRYLERQVRAAKRQQAVAIDDEAAKVAKARVRAYQAKIREHVDTTTAKRVPWREQIHD